MYGYATWASEVVMLLSKSSDCFESDQEYREYLSKLYDDTWNDSEEKQRYLKWVEENEKNKALWQ